MDGYGGRVLTKYNNYICFHLSGIIHCFNRKRRMLNPKNMRLILCSTFPLDITTDLLQKRCYYSQYFRCQSDMSTVLCNSLHHIRKLIWKCEERTAVVLRYIAVGSQAVWFGCISFVFDCCSIMFGYILLLFSELLGHCREDDAVQAQFLSYVV